jgi:hypothetical protein
MGTYLVIGLALAIAAALGFKRLARKGFEAWRIPLPLVKFIARLRLKSQRKFWSELGEALSIDPKLIRPDDKLKSLPCGTLHTCMNTVGVRSSHLKSGQRSRPATSS